MAPRTAKAKKTTEVKVAENEAPKKGRGKAKNTEECEQEVPEVEIDEKPVLTDKKTKRGKKPQENGDAPLNGTAEEAVPPAKRGRKKKEADLEPVSENKSSNGDHSAEEETPDTEVQNGDHIESNSTEDAQPVATGKGRKKAAKKEEKPKETAKGRKAKQASPDVEEKEEKVVEEKPKSKGRGRKPKAEAAPEPEAEEKTESTEEAKAEPATKGRKKAQAKPVKEKSPEPEESNEETDKQDELEEKPEAPKKETKGRKGKKTQPKEEGESEEKEPASKKRKVTKKEEKGQGDAKEEDITEDGEEEVEEAKQPKGKRGKKAEPALETDEEPADAEATSKRRRKPAEDKAPAEDKKKAAKNKSATNYSDIDFTNHSKNPQDKEWNFKISCWNVDGIRAWLNKGGLDYIRHEKPDILCLQETKCAKDKLPEELANVPGYHSYWVDSDKDGYAGVGLYTTRLAMNVHYGLDNKELDDEGRIITAEYEQFYLICVYVPNAGRKLVTLPKRLQWNEEFLKYVKELDKNKPVIICGDMNVAHNEIDLANPKTNRKNAGFTNEERAGMTQLLGEGFVDTFRHFYPDKTSAYTFWTYMMGARAKNVGWRLDYFIVSERLLPSVCDNVIRDQVYGSDHCPISLFLHLTSANKPKEA